MTSLLLKLQTDIDFSFLQNLWNKCLAFLPQLLKGVLFLIVGWLLIKIILFSIKKALKFSKIDSLPAKLKMDEVFKESSIKIEPTKIVLATIKWILILVFVIVGSELLGLRIISEQLSKLIGYLPRLISALAIFIFGIYLANLVKKALTSTFKSLELTGGNLIGNIVFYIFAVIVSVTALNQAGINTDLITSNFSIIFGAILAAFTISFGLGSRDVIRKLLFGYYSRKNLEVGQKIKVNEIEGVIESIDNICVVLITSKGKTVLPINTIVENSVEILS